MPPYADSKVKTECVMNGTTAPFPFMLSVIFKDDTYPAFMDTSDNIPVVSRGASESHFSISTQ